MLMCISTTSLSQEIELRVEVTDLASQLATFKAQCEQSSSELTATKQENLRLSEKVNKLSKLRTVRMHGIREVCVCMLLSKLSLKLSL